MPAIIEPETAQMNADSRAMVYFPPCFHFNQI